MEESRTSIWPFRMSNHPLHQFSPIEMSHMKSYMNITITCPCWDSFLRIHIRLTGFPIQSKKVFILPHESSTVPFELSVVWVEVVLGCWFYSCLYSKERKIYRSIAIVFQYDTVCQKAGECL